MTELKAGAPFGLDTNLIGHIDWALAVSRIENDIKTDFVYAPHLSFIYARARDALISEMEKHLGSSSFLPGVPITMEVPKSFRMKVAANIKRLGPNYTRPGSILLPLDRLFYQMIADNCVDHIENKVDGLRSFSHQYDTSAAAAMFLATRTCWSDLQEALKENSGDPNIKYILKIDIANFFGSINQHTLANHLLDAGCKKNLIARLELVLTSFAGNRSSRGIIQGIVPSDLFGNFYLCGFDKFLDDIGKRSARYVDDIYIFVESVEVADQTLRGAIRELRSYDLAINEAKASIIPKSALITEEPDLEELFRDALTEISEQMDDDDFDIDYGFQSEWLDEEEDSDEDEIDDTEEDDKDLELAATQLLFDSVSDYKGHEENIERFCLPLFMRANSDYAVFHVLSSISQRPSMTQIYCAYLAIFIDKAPIYDALRHHVVDGSLYDWQRMWILAALLRTSQHEDAVIKDVLAIFLNASKHDALRAVAAIFVGRFGDASRRKTLSNSYNNVSSYVQAAIYYSSLRWPGAERSNARASWGLGSLLNRLISKGNKPI